MQIRAAQRNDELRNKWMNDLSEWNADQVIFLDESAANEHTADRKYRWAPVGVTPHESRPFTRSERWSLLPAYTIDGFITWDIRHGSYTTETFEEFIEFKVLPLCNPYPLPRSIIAMDNAPIHQSKVYICLRIYLIFRTWRNYAQMQVFSLYSFHHIPQILIQLRRHLQS